MKTELIIKSLARKQKQLNRSMLQMQKDMDKIFKIEDPTKEQMKEAVLLFGSIGRYKRMTKEIDTIISGLTTLVNFNIDNL